MNYLTGAGGIPNYWQDPTVSAMQSQQNRPVDPGASSQPNAWSNFQSGMARAQNTQGSGLTKLGAALSPQFSAAVQSGAPGTGVGGLMTALGGSGTF